MTQYNSRMNEKSLIEQLVERHEMLTPRRIPQPDLAEAGVLVAITDEPEPKLLLVTFRSEIAYQNGLLRRRGSNTPGRINLHRSPQCYTVDEH